MLQTPCRSILVANEIILIDKVLEQCSYLSKGIVLVKLNYLADKTFLKAAKLPHKTENLIAPSPMKFLRQVDNQFVNSIVRKQRKLTDVEYENQKNRFLEDADAKLILLCLNLIKDSEDDIILVTEESEASNDNKLFKKIPAICKELNIKTLALPELLHLYKEIRFEFT